MRFYVGLHHPNDCRHFYHCMVSVNRIRNRKSRFHVDDWIMDSGAFTELLRHGRYRHTPQEYVKQILRWRKNGNMVAAVSQDYMCQPFICAKTGLDVPTHQRLTIERYDVITALVRNRVYIMPAIQGYQPEDYVSHLHQYGNRLTENQWVGVGSVFKRSNNARQIEDVLGVIRSLRPDLRLHGFGLRVSALQSPFVRSCLYSFDSMAWSFIARRLGLDQNHWYEAHLFAKRVNDIINAETDKQSSLI